jgi:hypothetical protein
MKLKYQSRAGAFEIEGTPAEVARLIREWESDFETKSVERPTEAQSLFSQSADLLTTYLTKSIKPDPLKEKVYAITSKKIAEYIASLKSPGMSHSIRDLMIHFLGQTIPSKGKQNEYQNLFYKMQAAHYMISKEKNGLWKKSKHLTDGERYVTYTFAENGEH